MALAFQLYQLRTQWWLALWVISQKSECIFSSACFGSVPAACSVQSPPEAGQALAVIFKTPSPRRIPRWRYEQEKCPNCQYHLWMTLQMRLCSFPPSPSLPVTHKQAVGCMIIISGVLLLLWTCLWTSTSEGQVFTLLSADSPPSSVLRHGCIPCLAFE